VEDHYGLRCTATGSESPSFNPAFPSQVVAAPATALDAVTDRYQRAGIRWLLKLHPERDSAIYLEAQARGWQFSAVPLLALTTDTYDPLPIPDELSIVQASEKNIADAVLCLAEAFDADAASVGHELGANLLTVPPFTVFVGYLNEAPVATSMLAETSGLAGIYGVATRPTLARRGLGTALTAAAIGEAARRGHDVIVLEPSEVAQTMYARMGFVQFGTYAEAAI